MSSYERRRNPDWSDENNFRNRSQFDRDMTSDREFYNQYRGSNFNPDFDNEQFGARRGQMSNPDYDYQPRYGSSRNWDYSNQGYQDRGFRAGSVSDRFLREGKVPGRLRSRL